MAPAVAARGSDMAPCDAFAQELRNVWSLGEGPQVEDALYAFATRPADAARTVKVQQWSEVLGPFHKAGKAGGGGGA